MASAPGLPTGSSSREQAQFALRCACGKTYLGRGSHQIRVQPVHSGSGRSSATVRMTICLGQLTDESSAGTAVARSLMQGHKALGWLDRGAFISSTRDDSSEQFHDQLPSTCRTCDISVVRQGAASRDYRVPPALRTTESWRPASQLAHLLCHARAKSRDLQFRGPFVETSAARLKAAPPVQETLSRSGRRCRSLGCRRCRSGRSSAAPDRNSASSSAARGTRRGCPSWG